MSAAYLGITVMSKEENALVLLTNESKVRSLHVQVVGRFALSTRDSRDPQPILRNLTEHIRFDAEGFVKAKHVWVVSTTRRFVRCGREASKQASKQGRKEGRKEGRKGLLFQFLVPEKIGVSFLFPPSGFKVSQSQSSKKKPIQCTLDIDHCKHSISISN